MKYPVSIWFRQSFIDGRTDGWMDGMGWDGWVGLLFFGFVYFSKTTSYIILIVSGPQRRHFQVSFVKKWTFRFFSANIPKNVQKHIFKGTEKIKKNYEVVFKIWAKKKSGPTIHPIPSHPIPSHSIHPSHPSIKKSAGAPGTPLRDTGREYWERLEYCLNVEGWINLNMCNFLLFSTDSIRAMNVFEVVESRVQFFL